MVLPLAMLLAAGGSGLQSYGQGQQEDARNAALTKYLSRMTFNNQGTDRDQTQTNAALGHLGEQGFQSNEQAVQDFSANNQLGAFNQASQGLQGSIDNVLASTPGASDDVMAMAGDNTAFTNSQARQKLHNDRKTQALQKVLTNDAGITGQKRLFSDTMTNKGNRDFEIQQRIMDLLRMQNYADGVREAALQKAGAEHGLDQSRAASVGSGAMYLGALMGAAAPLANRPATGINPGSQPGAYGNPVNGIDYTPNTNLNTGIA